jgi:hypothetical protein
VRLADRILIYQDATSTPTMKTQLITGVTSSNDLLVVE